MYSNNYLKETLSLIKSLNIILHAEAVSINIFYSKKYYGNYTYEEHDLSTWKYYLNMSGEFHTIDNLLYPDGLKVKFNDIEYNLTKTILENNELLKDELLKFGTLYKDIIKNYPNCELLLKGMLYSNALDDIIKYKDGTIIGYNKKLVENNEYNLIYELQEYIYTYIDRWLINEYVLVDDLVVQNFIYNLTCSLILKTLNIRLSKVGTDEVHSYYMSEYFKSNLELYKNTVNLNEEVKLYLYKNLKYLIKHTGKEETLKLIIDNILTPSGINTKEIIRKQHVKNLNDNTMEETLDKLYLINYDEIDLNENGISNNTVYDYELSENNLEDNFVSRNKFFNDITKSRLTNERSKLLILDYINSTKIFPLNESQLVYESWLYRTFNKNINTNFIFTDLNTNIKYTLDEKTALFIITKLLLKLIKKDNLKFKDFILSRIPSNDFDNNNLISNTDIADKIHDYLDNHDFDYSDKNIFNNLIELENLYWIYINDEYNPAMRADGSLIYERLHFPVKVELSDTDKQINDMFTDPIIYTNNYNYRLTISEIVKQFTGYDIDKKTTIDKFLEDFKEIVNKLTSYTTQVRTFNNYSSLFVTNKFNGHITGPNLCDITDTTFSCLEPLNYDLELESRAIDNRLEILNKPIGIISKVDINPYGLKLNILNTKIYEYPINSSITFTKNDNDKNNRFVYSLPGTF